MDDGMMGTRLRVAVIGLGRRWQRRYKPAISALKSMYAIRAVCDAVQARADAEAKRIGCRTSRVASVVERSDIDVLLLCDGQWFGMWPIELACSTGKPVLCAAPIEHDRCHLEALLRQVRDASLPVMVEMWPRVAPQVARLHELLATELRQPLLARCEIVGPKPESKKSCVQESLVPLIDWCVSVFKTEPLRSSPTALGSEQHWALDFGTGRRAELVRRVAVASPYFRFEIFATSGRALAEVPGHVAWTTLSGHQIHLIRSKVSVGRAVLEHFHHGVTTGLPFEPTLEDAGRIIQWLGTHSAD